MPIDTGIQNRNFEELFKFPVNYEIPFFQRAYSWERQQWKQLFEDLSEVLKDIVEKIKSEGEDTVTPQLLEKHLLEHEHYFGAVVVLEKRNSDPSLKSFSVIDGQQRITTIYLFLALLTQILKTKTDLSPNAQKYVGELESLIQNKIDTKGDDYKRLKVYSNKGDRLPTFLKIFESNPESPTLPIDQQLYVPGQNQIEDFWNYAYKKFRNEDVGTLYAYSQAILKALKIVWIPLDEKKDNPQAIFEGLNDKGMPLSAIELLCSFLFKPLINEVTKQHETIHNEKWLKSIKAVGGEDNFEFYLRTLFSIDKPKMIGKGKLLYSHFKNTHKGITEKIAFEHLTRISDHADLFNHIHKPQEPKYAHPNSEINTYLIKIKQTGMESSIPFTLSLLTELRARKINETDSLTVLNSLLVLLVRRKICELKTTKYDVFFPSLLGKIINEPDKAKAFQSQVLAEGLFVSDQEFEDAFINKQLYRFKELEFTRLILQDIDRKMQSFGQFPDYSSINTVEHVLPQELDQEWKDYLGTQAKDNLLDTYKHTLGNLCLISRPANSHAGRDPFEKKKEGYTDVSALTRDIKQRGGKWDIAAIKQRSKDLAKQGLEVWKWS